MVTGGEARPIKLSTILGGDNRLEASTYLREGYGLSRLARQIHGCVSLGDLTDIWQPSRLTGYLMPEGQGLPFFTAGQMFEDFPRVRKWLAEPFVSQKEMRYVSPGWLLMSRSGIVGRITAVYPHHLGKIVTDDLLRIIPKDSGDYGWLYAYMKTSFFQSIARASQYGHMIKHIEIDHADKFPVLMPEEGIRNEIGAIAEQAISIRMQAWRLRDEAFALLEKEIEVDCYELLERSSIIRKVSLSETLQNRSRLDADTYVGAISKIDKLVTKGEWDLLGELTRDVVEPPRFKRFYGKSNLPFVGISELFDVNARPTKFIYAKLVNNWVQYMLQPGTLVMARSGQKYGVLGRALMLTENHRNMMGSEHLTRIIPDEKKMRAGYLLSFINDPIVGRPSVVRHAFGTSIPELSTEDIKRIHVPRLGEAVEGAIADVMEKSVALSAEADNLENEATDRAEAIIDSMLEIVR